MVVLRSKAHPEFPPFHLRDCGEDLQVLHTKLPLRRPAGRRARRLPSRGTVRGCCQHDFL